MPPGIEQPTSTWTASPCGRRRQETCSSASCSTRSTIAASYRATCARWVRRCRRFTGLRPTIRECSFVTITANAVSVRKMTLLAMIAATYFMVAGGPQGLEDIVQKTGYSATLLILVITPLVWSVPAALMVSELATAIPEEGGFYVWVRRGLGPLMGYQEAWLSLAGSIFEMALYPSLFTDYLGRFAPWLVTGDRGLLFGFGMIAICTAWNLAGIRAMGDGSVALNVALLAPFAVLTVMAVSHAPSAAPAPVPLKRADLL